MRVWLDEPRTPRSDTASGDALPSHSHPSLLDPGWPLLFSQWAQLQHTSLQGHPSPLSTQATLRMSDLHVWGPGSHQAPPSPSQQTLFISWQEPQRSAGFCSKEKPLSQGNCWACEEQPQAPTLHRFSPGGKEHSSGDTRCGPQPQLQEVALDTPPQSLCLIPGLPALLCWTMARSRGNGK